MLADGLDRFHHPAVLKGPIRLEGQGKAELAPLCNRMEGGAAGVGGDGRDVLLAGSWGKWRAGSRAGRESSRTPAAVHLVGNMQKTRGAVHPGGHPINPTRLPAATAHSATARAPTGASESAPSTPLQPPCNPPNTPSTPENNSPPVTVSTRTTSEYLPAPLCRRSSPSAAPCISSGRSGAPSSAAPKRSALPPSAGRAPIATKRQAVNASRSRSATSCACTTSSGGCSGEGPRGWSG